MEKVGDYNERRRKEITLGQAMNQAIQLLDTHGMSYWRVLDMVSKEGFEDYYKKIVEKLYLMNLELQEELL